MTNPTELKLGTALWRGLQCRCPACGEGRLFGRFVKVAPACTRCGEAFHHHRADDFPAYLVIVLVGHLVLPLVLWVETAFVPDYWIHAALWLPAVVGLSVGLLQPVKGAVVALQWHTGMHGFVAGRLPKVTL
ncbi:MAG: DUF983 domain-containing protein [Alphaproteobacteria bacterium]|nr:DUF983 domain-containing protein [Alphaproteobacteria bacterium]